MMSKKEVVALEEAQLRARINRAMRWSDASKIAPDVPPPDAFPGYTAGWTFNSYDTGRVDRGWSTSVTHGSGEPPKDGERHSAGSQRGRAMYSTKVLALRAMRCEMEERFARILAGIDLQIEEVTR